MTLDEKIAYLIKHQEFKGKKINFLDNIENKNHVYTITCVRKGTKKSNVGIIIDSDLLIIEAIDLKQIKTTDQREEAIQYINYLKNNTLNKDSKTFNFQNVPYIRYTFSFNKFNDKTFENYARTRWGVFEFQWDVSCLNGNKEKIVSCFNEWSSLKKKYPDQLEVLKMLTEYLGQEFYDLIKKRLTVSIKSPLEKTKIEEEIKEYFQDALDKSKHILDLQAEEFQKE